MTTLYGVLGAVLLGGLAIWLGRRDARKYGSLEERAKGQKKAIEDAQEADEIRRDVARGAGRKRLRRFDRD